MKNIISLTCLFFFAMANAAAAPGYYLVSVYDNAGQMSIDYRYWAVRLPGYDETIWPELGFGYGVNSRWYSEFYVSTIGTSHNDLKLDTWNWQNDFLITQGQYPIDVAIHSNFVRAHDTSEGYSLELGPALQTDVGRVQLNGNVFFEKPYHSNYGNTTQLNYQWQAKYRWRSILQPGLQGFGELGDWSHWSPRSQQSHRIGPALSGSIALDPKVTLQYQAAYLTGSIYGQHGHMLTARVQLVW